MINEHNLPKFSLSTEPLWDLSWELGSLGVRPVYGLLALPIFRPTGDSLENGESRLMWHTALQTCLIKPTY
jgi:hypothetical protein